MNKQLDGFRDFFGSEWGATELGLCLHIGGSTSCDAFKTNSSPLTFLRNKLLLSSWAVWGPQRTCNLRFVKNIFASTFFLFWLLRLIYWSNISSHIRHRWEWRVQESSCILSFGFKRFIEWTKLVKRNWWLSESEEEGNHLFLSFKHWWLNIRWLHFTNIILPLLPISKR